MGGERAGFQARTKAYASRVLRLIESGTMSQAQLSALIAEGNELVAMTVASINTARKQQQ